MPAKAACQATTLALINRLRGQARSHIGAASFWRLGGVSDGDPLPAGYCVVAGLMQLKLWERACPRRVAGLMQLKLWERACPRRRRVRRQRWQ
ncbi:hypothetical protein FPT15_20820 [Pseudomonas sp. RGB]|nr:hypothetical protein FPT15_20820 [Pseudomonas sp. RGB]